MIRKVTCRQHAASFPARSFIEPSSNINQAHLWKSKFMHIRSEVKRAGPSSQPNPLVQRFCTCSSFQNYTTYNVLHSYSAWPGENHASCETSKCPRKRRRAPSDAFTSSTAPRPVRQPVPKPGQRSCIHTAGDGTATEHTADSLPGAMPTWDGESSSAKTRKGWEEED